MFKMKKKLNYTSFTVTAYFFEFVNMCSELKKHQTLRIFTENKECKAVAIGSEVVNSMLVFYQVENANLRLTAYKITGQICDFTSTRDTRFAT